MVIVQQEQATLVPRARYTVATESGHYIQLQQTALVIEAVRQVVVGVRDRDTWHDLVSWCGSWPSGLVSVQARASGVAERLQ